jgi:hypothetical protein
MSRDFNTPHRQEWNAPIHNILKAIDNHNQEFFKTGNHWHLKKADMLRTYLLELKEWIYRKENND